MTRTRRMNADEVERILQNYGFELISQKGSHRKWRNDDRCQGENWDGASLTTRFKLFAGAIASGTARFKLFAPVIVLESQ
jgi:HicA toxin of bacterial toxin-antitoxin,